MPPNLRAPEHDNTLFELFYYPFTVFALRSGFKRVQHIRVDHAIFSFLYPYSRFNAVEIGEVFERNDTGLKVRFDGEEISVYLNGFTTVKREYAINDPHTKVPHTEIVHITFYLYIE